MRAPSVIFVALLLALVGGPARVRAQSGGDFDLSWATADAGGGESRGGDWAIYGTAGQSDASLSIGGDFAVQSGFWNRLSGNLTPLARLAVFPRPKDLSHKILISHLMTNALDWDREIPLFASTSSPSTNGATITVTPPRIFYDPQTATGNPNVTDRFPYRVKDGYQGLGLGQVQMVIWGSPDTAPNALAITTLPDGNKQVFFAGIPYWFYLVQAATAVAPPTNWVTLSTNRVNPDGLWNYVDLDATNYPGRYYRSAYHSAVP